MHKLTALALALSTSIFAPSVFAGDPPEGGEPNARKPAEGDAEKAEPSAWVPRFSAAVGGISVPGTASVYGAQAAFVLPAPAWTKDVRIGLFVWKSEDEYTKGKGGMVVLEQNHWWTTYGLGYGSGLGTSSFEPKKSSGWDGSSTQIIAYFTPVQLRFGRNPAVEVSFDIGVTRFFDPPTKREDESGVRPFANLSLGLAL